MRILLPERRGGRRGGMAARRLVGLGLLLCLGAARPAPAELPGAVLEAPRIVTTEDWLQLRLQVLGLGLSYPAYRVALHLDDGGVRFEFWISTPMAQHLEEAGREESERILTYHARGIQRRVGDLLQREFADLAATYDGKADLMGEFLVPGEELDAPPQRWALWRDGDLAWSWRP